VRNFRTSMLQSRTMIAEGFLRWVGWGWGLAFLVWLGGSIVILTIGYRFFLERFRSRLPTAVVFIVWTLAVLGVAGSYLGYGVPVRR
jgi:hypothetical protein